ncbi:head-tail adaptor protein [Wukongibacter sp. M2B1]|uniref:head-tail adaptor protein n=1 Tax=Wukongibacter sp. M2B1 TaxID=3088895 RepID=UPI003D7AECE7
MRKNIRIGNLKHRIDVYGKVKQKNNLNATEYKDEKVKTIWCAIIPQTASMGKRVGTEFAKMTHKILVRYGAGKDIVPKQHFVYKSRRFDILYKLNPFEANEYYEFFVQEVIE